GLHILSPELRTKNAPMVLSSAAVGSEFIAQVKIAGIIHPGSEPAIHRNSRLPFTFQGAGLLLWQDANNYLRLERTAGTSGSSLTLVHRLLLEVCKGGRPAGHIYLDVPEGPLYLRLERHGEDLRCMFGQNGKTWVS